MNRYKFNDKEEYFEYLKNYSLGANLTKITVTFIQCGTFVGITYILYLMVGELAGKQTAADITISLWDKALAVIFGGGGVLYGHKERKLRKDTVERLQKRNIELESMIDKNRSTSGLTPLGDTDPEDL